MEPKRVLFLGDDRHGEFRWAVEWLQRHTRLTRAADLPAALARLAESSLPPHRILIAQARPGQFAAWQIERLYQAAPLSPLVALLGSWCEGELRTGQPWPGVVRIYWHQWTARGEQELACALDPQRDPQGAGWSLPRTASDVERLLHSGQQRPIQREGLIAIRAEQALTFHCLADACSSAGYGSVWLPAGRPVHVQRPTAMLWDAAQWDTTEADQLRQLAASFQAIPSLALINFPRMEDHRQALAAGATAVLSKPFLQTDLLVQLDRLVGRQSEPHHTRPGELYAV